MDDPLETIDYRGHTINIYTDWHADSPDEWGDDGLFLLSFHRDFYVTRKFREPDDAKCRFEDTHHMFLLAAYIHSGVALSLSRTGYPFTDPWDTSTVGWVFVAKSEWPDPEEAMEAAEGLVRTWNMFLSNSVYWYETLGPDDDHVDNCCGFYEDVCDWEESDILQEARSNVDYAVKEAIKKHTEYLKRAIRSGVPLQYRQPLEFA